MAWRRIDVHRAVERGDIAVLKRYLDAGGDVEKKDEEYGAAPVHWAALRGRLEALALLLGSGGDLESRTGTDGTPLVWGCMGGDISVVRYLLEQGANISAVTKGKGTALHHATHSGYPEVVALLLAKGADPEVQDNRGEKPGDHFDPEVSESNRRAIAKVLAKAARRSSSLRRSSSERSRRHLLKARGGGKLRSASDRSISIAEDDALSAAAAAIAAAAWTPSSPSRRPRSVAIDTTGHSSARRGWSSSNGGGGGGGGSLDTIDDHNVSNSQQSGGVDARNPSRHARHSSRHDGSSISSRSRSGNYYRYAFPARQAATAADEGHLSLAPLPPPPPPTGYDGTSALANLDPEESSLGLDDLRRRVKNVTLAAANAEARGVEGMVSMRRALKEADERAQAAAAAERTRSEKLDALVQALEQRLRDRDEQVASLTSELENRKSRLRHRDRQVVDLRKRVEELLLSRGNPGSASAPAPAPPEAEEAPHTTKCVDGTPRDEPTVPPPCEEETEESGASFRRSYLRTRSSPTLSPTPEAAASALLFHAGVVNAGADGVSPAPGSEGEAFARRTTAGDGGGVASGTHSRRSTIGPGTVVAANDDESFGHALESLAARDVGAAAAAAAAGRGKGGGEGRPLRAGVAGWWKHSDWLRKVPGVERKIAIPPPPAVAEDQERLGSLYSMIARR